jgi:hypothetical protein
MKGKPVFKKILLKGENSLLDFWHKTRIEVRETKQAEKIFIRYVENKEVSKEEKTALRNQSIDLAKVIFIGIPLAIVPGFSVVMIVLVKLGQKYKFNVLPSAFAPPKPSAPSFPPQS